MTIGNDIERHRNARDDHVTGARSDANSDLVDACKSARQRWVPLMRLPAPGNRTSDASRRRGETRTVLALRIVDLELGASPSAEGFTIVIVIGVSPHP
ncbi:hypothetical protein C5B85_07245 [Pseudoclavibacter sp. AY1F1]|uniref:hypothetical protein n=1 Tax=Pseudoclavibacter sp. AY1F1 TaxID=2080583 RepID=UPI000CE7D6A5|nr:hypothetical protein [Pseudoclavibacter sp. AY1F1]PPF45368.1 hypothetical protein C5B85_07245 [Pseudoclavibacter sp. AY1F1]